MESAEGKTELETLRGEKRPFGLAGKIFPTTDPEAVVLVGTRAWSSLGLSDGSSETEVINNKVNASNIMYTFHFCAGTHATSMPLPT